MAFDYYWGVVSSKSKLWCQFGSSAQPSFYFFVQKNYFTSFESLNLFLAPISQTRNKIKALLNHFVPYERTLVYFLFVIFWDPHFFLNFRFPLVGLRHVRSFQVTAHAYAIAQPTEKFEKHFLNCMYHFQCPDNTKVLFFASYRNHATLKCIISFIAHQQISWLTAPQPWAYASSLSQWSTRCESPHKKYPQKQPIKCL